MRESAPICDKRDDDGDDSVGCVLEALIPEDRTYLVSFLHEESGDDPDICWRTCRAVFPNASLALVSWEGGQLLLLLLPFHCRLCLCS